MRISDTGITRRALLGGIAAPGLVSALPRMSFADATSDAASLVDALAAELTRMVNSGRGTSQLYGEFERLLAKYADMPVVAASSLGPAWRGASNAQKQAYVTAFQTYLSRKYGRQFDEFRSARIEVSGARDAGKAGILVNTSVLRPGRETIRVDWQISDRSGRPQAVNLVIEGVSLLANERAEIGAMLDASGGLDGLIAELRRRG